MFRGNRDGNTVMKHYLKEKLVAKTLRILRHQNSKDFMGSTVCLRAEVYGCEFQTGECRLSWDALLMLETDRKCRSQIAVICITFSLSSDSPNFVSWCMPSDTFIVDYQPLLEKGARVSPPNSLSRRVT